MEGRDSKGRFIKGFKRGPRTIEVKEKISIANSDKRNGRWKGGKPVCKKCGIQIWWGSNYCIKHVDRSYLSNDKLIKKRRILLTISAKRGKDHPNWKGDKASYNSIHRWVRRYLGKANYCKICGCKDIKKYDWVNKNYKYKRNLTDWISVCRSCHRKADYRNLPLL